MQKGVISSKLIIAVTVAGLTAGVAFVVGLPAYHDYQVRAQVAEVFASVEACEKVVADGVRSATAPTLNQSLFICDGGAAAGSKISKHLKSIAVNDRGSITVTLDYRSLSQLSPTSNILTVTPLVKDLTPLSSSDGQKNIASWRCGSSKDGTTIPANFLPTSCRG